MSRSPGAELRQASSRRHLLHPFKSFSTSRVPRPVPPSTPERDDQKPKIKESRGFFSQLRRSLTLGSFSSSSSSRAATIAARPAPASKEGAAAPSPSPSPWGRRVKNGLSKPLKVVTTGYVDCMMGIAEDPRVEGLAAMDFHPSNSHAYAFQASSSRRLQPSAAASEGLIYRSDEQLRDLLRCSQHKLSSKTI